MPTSGKDFIAEAKHESDEEEKGPPTQPKKDLNKPETHQHIDPESTPHENADEKKEDDDEKDAQKNDGNSSSEDEGKGENKKEEGEEKGKDGKTKPGRFDPFAGLTKKVREGS